MTKKTESSTKKRKFHVAYLIPVVFVVFGVFDLLQRSQAVLIPYSVFQQQLDAGNVKQVSVLPDALEGELKQPFAEGPFAGRHHFSTQRVSEGLAVELARRGVEFKADTKSDWVPMLFAWLVPVALFGGVWYVLSRRTGQRGMGGLLPASQPRLKVLVESDVKTRFADVAGVDEAKAELEEIVAFLRDPKAHGRLGARIPKGVVLVGPPGTGKTLLARAVAGEAGVPFFSMSGSQFVEMFVGVGAARVRDLFEQARAKAPAIVFIDELDALGRARGAYGPGGGGPDEKEHTLNQLLVEMDGFDPTSGVVLLAATNRPEILDPALLRAGRFDRQVLVDRPDRVGRAQILRVHTTRVALAPGVDVEDVARLTPGFTGADLANLVNEAALAATRRGAPAVAGEDFTTAVERIVAGLEKKNRLMNPMERAIVAHHEMGHAIVAAAQPECDPVHKVSIIPRGIGALGYTIQRPTEDRWLMTRAELEAKMAVLLAGRAAERLVFDHVSTGAVDDLSRATEVARGMATRYAMVPELGCLAYEAEPSAFTPGVPAAQRRLYSERTAWEIDEAMRTLVDLARSRADRILARNRELLTEGARLLLDRETLAEDELAALLHRVQPLREPAVRRQPEVVEQQKSAL